MDALPAFPGLAPFDSLRTHAAGGGHITTQWYTSDAPAGDVTAWYRARAAGYQETAPGGWSRVRVDGGLRHVDGVTVYPAGGPPPPGPQPQVPVPAGARTVVRRDSGAVPDRAAAPPAPATRPTLLRRLQARLFG